MTQPPLSPEKTLIVKPLPPPGKPGISKRWYIPTAIVSLGLAVGAGIGIYKIAQRRDEREMAAQAIDAAVAPSYDAGMAGTGPIIEPLVTLETEVDYLAEYNLAAASSADIMRTAEGYEVDGKLDTAIGIYETLHGQADRYQIARASLESRLCELYPQQIATLDGDAKKAGEEDRKYIMDEKARLERNQGKLCKK
jgi:hypothetical protein